ncbi:tyrosine-type recombinase/integrase [Tritonibacter sp. SIMBA_163]|uniref:tyrosine-type recombinase/integrase n=1 Tax=Tritonibacter sp. SIMBA_163 TaxID=3080868 RepID=UPI00397EB648
MTNLAPLRSEIFLRHSTRPWAHAPTHCCASSAPKPPMATPLCLKWWHRFKKKLEAEGVVEPGLTLKGLRHTVATTLREAGLEERQIADLLGQKTPSMARHYSRSANLADRNRITMETLKQENERRSQVVKPFAKTVKP